MALGLSCQAVALFLAIAAFGGVGPSKAWGQDSQIDVRDLDPPPAGITLGVDQGDQPEGDAFRVGFLADAAPGHQRTLYRPYRDYLEQVLQRPVEFVPFRDARGLVLAMQRESISYGMAPGSVFAATHRSCACVEALGTQPNRDGSIGFFSVLLVADGPQSPRDLGDIDGAALAIVGEDSVVAHRVGMSELWRAELVLNEDEMSYVTSIEDAHSVLLAGGAQAILTWARQADGRVLFDREPFATLSQEARAQLRLLWRSRPMPAFTHYAHRNLDNQILATLRDGLLGLTGRDGDAFDAIDLGSGRGFEPLDISDFQPYLDAYSYWDQAAQAER